MENQPDHMGIPVDACGQRQEEEGRMRRQTEAAPTPKRPTQGAPAGSRERFVAPGYPGIDCVPAPRVQAAPGQEEPLSAIEKDYEESADPGTPLAERRFSQFE